MSNPSQGWLTGNLRRDYPFEDGSDPSLRGLFSDAALSCDRPAERVRITLFDPANGRVVLARESGGVLADLRPADALSVSDLPRFRVWEWRRTIALSDPSGPETVFRLVCPLTALASFPVSPAAAWLVNSVVEFRPLRVRRIALKTGVTIDRGEGAFRFDEGWNTQLAIPTGPPLGPKTVRETSRLQVAAFAGAGAGLVPGCADSQDTVNTISGAGPDARGNLNLTGDGCLRVQPPDAGSIGVATKPFTTYSADLLTKGLKILSDCQACCSCADYGDAGDALNRVWAYAQSVSARLLSVKAAYDALSASLGTFNGDQEGLKLLCRSNAQPGYTVTFQAVVINNTHAASGAVHLEFDLAPDTPADPKYVSESGHLQKSGGTDEQLDPTITDPVTYEVDLPDIPPSGFAAFSFGVRWTPSATGPGTCHVIATAVDMSTSECDCQGDLLEPEDFYGDP